MSADEASRRRKHMLGESNVHRRNHVGEAVIDHAPPRTVTDFLSRLKQRYYGSIPTLGSFGEQCSSAEQACDVHVVAAGVHDGYCVTCGVVGVHGTGVRKAGRLLDGGARPCQREAAPWDRYRSEGRR